MYSKELITYLSIHAKNIPKKDRTKFRATKLHYYRYKHKVRLYGIKNPYTPITARLLDMHNQYVARLVLAEFGHLRTHIYNKDPWMYNYGNILQ